MTLENVGNRAGQQGTAIVPCAYSMLDYASLEWDVGLWPLDPLFIMR